MATKSNSVISTLDDEPTPSVASVEAEILDIKGANHDAQLSGKMEIITIHSTPDEMGAEAVPVGLNGYAYQIPRDKPFRVPTEVAQILRDAITTQLKPGPNGTTTERSAPRHAFSSQPA